MRKLKIQSQKIKKPANKVVEKQPFERGESSAGIAQTVYDQLSSDYKKNLLHWVLAAQWEQMEVPLDHIDESNKVHWQASGPEDVDKVKDMAEKMEKGWFKPIILINEPNNSKLQIADGHHRYLAAKMNGMKEMPAFVATVGGTGGQWKEMHDLQRKGEGSNQSSNQESQQQ